MVFPVPRNLRSVFRRATYPGGGVRLDRTLRPEPSRRRSGIIAVQDSSVQSIVEDCYREFRVAHREQNYGTAYRLLVTALNAEPDIAYRYFITRASAAVTNVVRRTGKSRELVAWLNQAIETHPNINLLCNDQSEVGSALKLREANIRKGLPSVAVVTMGKAASVFVGNLFSSGFNLPCFAYSLAVLEVIESWAKDFARGGACYTTHLDPLERSVARLRRAGVDKVVVHVRDPRQRLLSMIHHVLRYDVNSRLKNSGFAERSMDERVEDMMDSYLRSIEWLQGWAAAEKELNILFSTFEELAADRDAFVRRYLEFYGAPMDYFNSAHALTMHDNIDYHFRSGRTDEWREVFSPHTADRLSALLPASLKQRFGWAD
jgi:hypothetical protein